MTNETLTELIRLAELVETLPGERAEEIARRLNAIVREHQHWATLQEKMAVAMGWRQATQTAPPAGD